MDNNKEQEEREIIVYPLSYYLDDNDKLLAYTLFLDRHIRAGNKIPARVLKKFMAIFSETETIREELVSRQKKHLIETTLIFFKKIRGYDFKIVRMEKN